jgi:PAS domain S-box-containing protein
MPIDIGQLLASPFAEATDPAYIADPLADRILAANAAGAAMLGYTRDELLATPVSAIHPADLPQLREFVERVRRDGAGTTLKLTCRAKDGTFLPTEMSLVALGEGSRVLALLHDRSEHRQRAPGG